MVQRYTRTYDAERAAQAHAGSGSCGAEPKPEGLAIRL